VPLQATQIVSLAAQVANVPGFTAQAGQLLNMILSDLCETYDFDLAKKTVTINLGVSSGPYPLPADYLRALRDDIFYTFNGVPYPLVPVDLSEWDSYPQQAGFNAYPTAYATDMSQSPPVLYVWPSANGQLPLTIRYYSQMPDIAQPETSSVVPWFPNQDYLITRLAGELMRISDDDRYEAFLGSGDAGAQGILRRYLELKDDSETRSKRVTLDKRFFRPRWGALKNTKSIGF
jgi:hypothetical protein